MANNEDQDAPVESTAARQTTPLTTEAAAHPTVASTKGRGLALAGIIGGSVAVAALLFAGGVAVGVALPDRAPIGFAQAVLPGGGPGGFGMHEGTPGGEHGPRGGGVRPDSTESDSE